MRYRRLRQAISPARWWLLAGGAVVLFCIAAPLAPSTPFYRALVRSLWQAGWHQAAYTLNISDPTLALQEGTFYFAGGAYDLPKAEYAFMLASRLRPTSSGPHYMLARVLFSEGKFDEAIQAIDTELKLDPQNLRSLYIRGLIYLYRGKPGDLNLAETDFRQFSQWSPGEWAGYNDLAFTLEKEAKYPAAQQVLESALVHVPNGGTNPWLWNSLGATQLNQLQYREAHMSFEKALTFAKKLTIADWRQAYSGDNPADDRASIQQFISAIQANLAITNN